MSARRPASLLALLVAPLKLAARLLAGLEWLGRAVLGAIALAVGLMVLVALAVAWHAKPPATPLLPHRFILDLTLDGSISETPPLTPPLALWDEEEEQNHLGSLLEALAAAATDPRVVAVTLDLSRFSGASYAQLAELRDALARCQAAGKPVYAFADRFDQKRYYLASIAREITLDPEGFVLLPGLALEPTYLKAALDRLGVTVYAFRAGRYKSFVEPFTRNAMSEEERSAVTDLLFGLWHQVRDAIAAARHLPPAAVDRYHAAYDERLTAHGGDGAQTALAEKLVDLLAPRDAWEKRVGDATGLDLEHDRVSWHRYLAAHQAKRLLHPKGGEIRVIVVDGTIVERDDGSPTAAASDRLVEALNDARDDAAVRAVVLRIASPGGSAFAAEEIRRAVAAVRSAGKPVVASFAGVAASGGYWIATAADAITARPETLTGSIGVFALIPNAARLLEKLDLTTDGVRTGPFAAPLDPRQPLPEAVTRALDASVSHTYRRFLTLVSEGRKIPASELPPIAEGRVWLGSAAVKLGLVDELGGLERALALARERAGAPDAEVRWATEPPTVREWLRRLLFTLQSKVSAVGLTPSLMGTSVDTLLLPPSLTPLVATLARELTAPTATLPPLWAHCLCTPP